MSIQFVSRDHYLPSYQVMNLVQMQMNVSRITFDHLSKYHLTPFVINPIMLQLRLIDRLDHLNHVQVVINLP